MGRNEESLRQLLSWKAVNPWTPVGNGSFTMTDNEQLITDIPSPDESGNFSIITDMGDMAEVIAPSGRKYKLLFERGDEIFAVPQD